MHRPGPWTAHADDESYENWRTWLIVGPTGDIARVWGSSEDATLMAEAPNLLAALEATMGQFETVHPDTGERHCEVCRAIGDADFHIPYHLDGFPCKQADAAIRAARSSR